MAQHFLLTAQARDIGLVDVMSMSDAKINKFFRAMRWHDANGKPYCPSCGCTEHWRIKSTNRYKCKGCHKQYSVTSGTVFADHKLSLRTIFTAIIIYTNAVKSISALQLSRDLNVQYKTAFVLLHKIREVLMDSRDESPIEGVVEMDGAYTNHHVRPENRKEDRVDRRLKDNQSPNKRCVMSLRQRGSKGADRTLTFITENENKSVIRQLTRKYFDKYVQVHTDELDAHFDCYTVNHQNEYSGEDGANNNQAESYFARFRRMMRGQIHKASTKYLDVYANEIAYREDTRRWDNLEIVEDITKRCMASQPTNYWRGYWQGNHRTEERMVS